MAGNPIQKYLAQYAEPETKGWQDFPHHFNQVVVIPAYDESAQLIESINNHHALSEALVIVVLNVPEGLNSSSPSLRRTQNLKKALREGSQQVWQHPYFKHIELVDYQNIKLLLIDRIEQPIPNKQGVGLARKIGADIALQLYELKKITCPWLHSTDADVSLPANYFQQTQSLSSQFSAACYSFTHGGEPSDLLDATKLYEKKLHYYLAGLKWAGSPYAFPTIGSTLAINFSSYAKVRGFPKRNAGEDFYLLNKLAKISPVVNLSGDKITISARASNRVPFGTGPAVTRLLEQQAEQCIYDSPLFYHPQSFTALKEVIESFAPLSHGETTCFTSPLIPKVLESMTFFEQYKQAYAQYKLPEQRLRYLHQWFDGFRTLKFIHALRAEQHSDLSWNQLCEYQTLAFFKTADATAQVH